MVTVAPALRSDEYFRQYRRSRGGVGVPARHVEAFYFGFTPADGTEIAELVLAGAKTATGSVLWSYEADGKPVPAVGDHWVVTRGGDDPACVIETVGVEILAFEDVGEEYAVAGGEGDKTLATWRPMYWSYIVSECKRIGREPSPRAPLVMERFRVVYAVPLLA